ncbi:MAG: aminoglycoside phosphotransferase family protein [Chloroflexota bacterium]|nr:aminoglycoside phosphotransferase family protein [Chloroflexota bacterium]
MTIDLDEALLTRIAQRALDAPEATLLDYGVLPLDYDAYLPGRVVARVTGHAAVGGRRKPWSAILKWTDSPATTPTAPIERARREALAYRSGLLDATGGLGVPRAYEIDLAEDGHVALWLEHIPATDDQQWPLEMYATAAYALGRFNGTFLVQPLPDHSWLVTDWAARQSEPLDMAVALAEIARRASDDRARRALGEDIGQRAAHMLEDQPRFIADLARLPQTLCHHDAARSNLIARSRGDGATEMVAIDWESTGHGAVGAEIATLVSASLRKGDFPADRAAELDATVVDAYLAGLRDAGWSGDPRFVRLGYAMSLALRCWFVRDTLRNLTDAEPGVRFGRAPDVPAGDVLRAFVLVSRFLLDRTDEARALAATLLPAATTTDWRGRSLDARA